MSLLASAALLLSAASVDAQAGDLLPNLLSSSAEDGVTMQLHLRADESVVRRLISSAETAAKLSPDVLGVRSSPRGNCEQIEVETRGFMSSLNYTSLRCPTASGWTEQLVSSDDFAEYDVEWSLQPTEDGTLVTYRIDIAMKDLPVPERMLRSNLSSSMKHSLMELAERALD